MLTARVPNKTTLIITHHCNHSCEFCFDASNILANGAAAASVMSLESFEQILRTLRQSIPRSAEFNVTLSGGEPTLHPNFFELLRQITEAGFTITILSNGQRLADKKFMAEVLKYNLWNFQFSIEGASAEVHDQRVGLAGSWKRVIAAIENAKAYNARFITNSTMTRTSVEEMFRIIDLLDGLGVPKMNIGNTLPECAGRNDAMLMQYPEVVEVAEALTLYTLTKRVGFSFITPLPVCLKQGRVISNPSVCSAGQYSAIIDTDGTCRPCSVCSPDANLCPKIGEVASYQEIGKRLDAVVQEDLVATIPAECKASRQFASCKAACPLYWKVPGIPTPGEW